MKRPVVMMCVGAALAGGGLAIVDAGKWLHALSAPDTFWAEAFLFIRSSVWIASALIVVGLTILLYALALRFDSERKGNAVFRYALGIALGLAIYSLVIRFTSVFHLVSVGYAVAFAVLLAACSSLIVYISVPPPMRNARSAMVRGAAVAIVWMLLELFMRLSRVEAGSISFGGWGTFAALSNPPELRAYPSLISDLATGAIVGASAGAALTLVRARGRAVYSAFYGLLTGAWISGVFYAAHSAVGTAIMQSAFNERTACIATLVAVPSAAIAAAVGIGLFIGSLARRVRFVLTGAIILLIGASAVYVADSRAGADLYLAAVRSPNYGTRAYIHYTKDGGWTRTFERHADPLIIDHCDRLIKRYPRSIYYSQAVYLKAKSQFASWQFAEASNTLEELRHRYKSLRGASSVLKVYTQLVQGQFGDVIDSSVPCDHMFVSWRAAQGRMMVAHAYEAAGSKPDALAAYTFYVYNQGAGTRSSWSHAALSYAENRIDSLGIAEDSVAKNGVVLGVVRANSHPLSGAYVALVEPHIDAAYPDESRQFTGASTVPLWFGLAATTDSEGRFTIEKVPYGDYELVVGADVSKLPAERVISKQVPVISVNNNRVRIDDINFVPAIELLSPVAGETVSRIPTLKWSPHPGAAYYAVTIVTAPTSDTYPASNIASSQGRQCWSMSHIRSTSVSVSPDGFSAFVGSPEARALSLLPGRHYSWMVLAYDDEGRVLSSSESYRMSSDPTFQIAFDTRREVDSN